MPLHSKWLATTLSLSLLTACQASQSSLSRVAVPFTLEAATSAKPQMVVRIAMPERRIQATANEVAWVAVSVRLPDGREPEQRLARASFNGGEARATFVGLEPGNVTVHARALDAQQRVIGTAAQTAIITAGQVSELAIDLDLVPRYAESGIAGSGSAQIGFTFQDGPLPALPWQWGPSSMASKIIEHAWTSIAMTVSPQGDLWFADVFNSYSVNARGERSEYDVPGTLSNVVFDSAGRLWGTLEGQKSLILFQPLEDGPFRSYAPDRTVPLPERPTQAGLARDQEDRMWIENGRYLTQVSRMGDKNWEIDLGEAPQAFAVDPIRGVAWVMVGGSLRRIDATGVTTAHVDGLLLPGDVAGALAVAPNGDVWLAHYYADLLSCLSPDGTLKRTVRGPSSPDALTIAPDGSAWVASSASTLSLYSPEGVYQGQYVEQTDVPYLPTPMRHQVVIDGRGHVWFQLRKTDLYGTDWWTFEYAP